MNEYLNDYLFDFGYEVYELLRLDCVLKVKDVLMIVSNTIKKKNYGTNENCGEINQNNTKSKFGQTTNDFDKLDTPRFNQNNQSSNQIEVQKLQNDPVIDFQSDCIINKPQKGFLYTKYCITDIVNRYNDRYEKLSKMNKSAKRTGLIEKVLKTNNQYSSSNQKKPDNKRRETKNFTLLKQESSNSDNSSSGSGNGGNLDMKNDKKILPSKISCFYQNCI